MILPFRSVLVLIAAIPCTAVLGQVPEAGLPRIALPLMKESPKVDGTIDETEWRQAARLVDLIGKASGAATTRPAVFWIGCDGRTVYLAVKSEAPPDGRILTRAVPDSSRDVVAAFHDDSIELVLDPRRGSASSERKFYHMIFNARGALYDWAVDPLNRQAPVDLTWRVRDWHMEQSVRDGWWHVEVAVPLASIGAGPKDLTLAWGVQIARNWKRPAEQSQWASQVTSYDDQPSMPLVTWRQAAPVVRVLSAGRDGKPSIEVGLLNPGTTPLGVRARVADAWHRDPPQEKVEGLMIAAGAEQRVSLPVREGGPEGMHTTSIEVTSSDGREAFFRRTWKWSGHAQPERWGIAEEQRQAVDLQFKYYPYYGKVGFRVSVESLPGKDAVRGATALVWRADAAGEPSGPPLWQQPVVLRNDVAESLCKIPELTTGRYVFGVRLEGGPGVPGRPVLQPFVRKVFEWEHNRLGLSEEVLPPFTPLEVQGSRVSAVLREHEHGPEGLWSRVTAAGRQILAGPMRLEVSGAEPGGKPQRWPVQGDGWRVGSHRPTEVRGQATWSAGPLHGTIDTHYDYDGMMLVGLSLEPTAVAKVHRVSLAIPLDETLARYLHPVSDGLRHNYAGFLPKGQGKIWDSSKAGKLEIPGTFYPYIWIGDGERGLCWFADTDRDWILDEQTPTLELVREEGQVVLRVNFVTRPGAIDRQHRIVFGLQATPTKPMPEGWRRWTASKSVAGGRPVRWVGACYYWGGMSYDVYPYQRRLEFYDKLAESRRSGQIDKAFIERWMAMLEKDQARKGTPRHELLLRHVWAGFHAAKGSPWAEGWRLFGYTNPRGVGFHVPEFATFQDEWLRYRFFNRKWGREGDVGYDVSPCPSFQDYCLWYYRKMLACFDGVYWDNVFLSAHFDPLVGQSWVDADGRIHPSFGLMHLRELLKRTAVMLWQESKSLADGRRPPVSLAHMTNTMLVPVMSFINCTMDWEWKYGNEDFQDRFSPDLTVTETIGRQIGAWPTILGGGHWDLKDPRVDFMRRTRLGVCLAHEIQAFDYGPERDREIYRKLFEFGYGGPDCRMFNYWESGHPVQVEGTQACVLAAARRGKALVVITDYGQGGAARVRLDLGVLRLRPEAAATDLESGQPVDRAGPGVFAVPIKRHDFRILKVE